MEIKRGTVLYMKVTRDKYELPLAVADSIAELGRILGIENTNKIASAISHSKHGRMNSTYKRVVIDEEVDP